MYVFMVWETNFEMSIGRVLIVIGLGNKKADTKISALFGIRRNII